MTTVAVAKVAVTLLVRVSADELEQHLVSSPRVLGTQLAEAVDTHVRRENIGYYPPLSYYSDKLLIDQELLNVTREIAWFVNEYVREQVRRQLRHVFSQVKITQVQSVAFTMPSVRTSDADALQLLANHYTPDTVRLSLLLSSIEKEPVPEDIQRLTEYKVVQWLRDHFAHLEIVSSRVA
jgi:hypothetical protein